MPHLLKFVYSIEEINNKKKTNNNNEKEDKYLYIYFRYNY